MAFSFYNSYSKNRFSVNLPGGVVCGSPGLSSPGCPELSWPLLGSPELPWALLSSLGLSWALLGSPGLSRALLGSPELSWALRSLRGSPGLSWALQILGRNSEKSPRILYHTFLLQLLILLKNRFSVNLPGGVLCGSPGVKKRGSGGWDKCSKRESASRRGRNR